MSNNEFFHIETPTYLSTYLSAKHGVNVYVKMECYQPVGSFKIRGPSQCENQA
jgi:threonine dehydratase